MYMRIAALFEKFGAVLLFLFFLRALRRNEASTEHNMLLQVPQRSNPTEFKSFFKRIIK